MAIQRVGYGFLLCKPIKAPKLEFYHLEKLETNESRAPTRASERVAIRVAIEESLR